MYCLIISDSAGFPWGMAATARVKNIGKAIIHQGGEVLYLGLRGSNTSYHRNKKKSGSYDGIKYIYPGGLPIRSKNWYVRRVDDLLGKWLSFILIKRLKKQESLNSVIIYSRSYNTVMFWSKKLKQMDIRVILELCEWPIANVHKNNRNLENAKKFCNYSIFVVDAILPISQYIENEVQKIAKENSKIPPAFRLPILTDFTLLSNHRTVEGLTNEEEYILYSGSFNYLDIAYIIVDIISELKIKGFNIKIKFTGSGKTNLFNQINTYINKKNVVELFHFTGYLEENELYNYMRNALCLLAPLPETEQSKARFPTKIGYYLSSGRPIVTNAIGSVNEYLSDGVNAYIANNCDPSALAEKVIDIVNDSVKANMIGKNGQQLSDEKFFYKNACIGLREFLENTIIN